MWLMFCLANICCLCFI